MFREGGGGAEDGVTGTNAGVGDAVELVHVSIIYIDVEGVRPF